MQIADQVQQELQRGESLERRGLGIFQLGRELRRSCRRCNFPAGHGSPDSRPAAACGRSRRARGRGCPASAASNAKDAVALRASSLFSRNTSAQVASLAISVLVRRLPLSVASRARILARAPGSLCCSAIGNQGDGAMAFRPPGKARPQRQQQGRECRADNRTRARSSASFSPSARLPRRDCLTTHRISC